MEGTAPVFEKNRPCTEEAMMTEVLFGVYRIRAEPQWHAC